MKLRVNSAAPMSSTSDSATSVMARTRRVLDADTAARVKRKRAAYAAATPKPSAAISASRPATDSTRQSNPTSSALGSEPGTSNSMTFVPHNASVSPTTMPRRQSTRVSVTSCRARRPRVAPNADRTASSRSRA